MTENKQQKGDDRSLAIDRLAPLSSAQIRRSTYTTVLLALLLPPFMGCSLMGIIGYYPMPEIYLVFTSYSAPYLAFAITLGVLIAPRIVRFVTGLDKLEREVARARAQYAFARMPWFLVGGISLYSIGGALSADLSIEAMGYRSYSIRDHLYSQFGLIPVVLITAFPIFFYYVDRLGRYLGPRGISVTAIPMWAKLLMLGIVTPLLIDSLLIGYYINRTGYFEWPTLFLWASLILLAAGGTWLAWRSLRQGIAPLQAFINAPSMALAERARANLTPLSLDEFGTLTARFAELLSSRRQLSGELQRAETLANAVIDHAGALVLVLDRQGHIVRFNHACEALSGYTFAEVEGRYPWDILLPPDDAAQIRDRAFKALASGSEEKTGRYTNRWITKSGESRLLDWTNTRLLDGHGNMEFIISIGVDVTEKARVEQTLRESEARLRQFNEELENRVSERTEELVKTNADLQRSLQQLNETQVQLVQSEKMASLGGLVAGVAHEINTPVGVGVTAITHLQMKIEQYAERYHSNQLTRDDFENLLGSTLEASKIIFNNLNRAAELIRSFKQVAVDQTSNEVRSFRLKEYLEEIMQSLNPKLKSAEHQVQIDCRDDIEINNHPGALSQVITNLVMNSVLHGFEERRNGMINIKVQEKPDGHIELDYRDNGKGIEVENIQKVFEPFFTTRRGQGGTGLGMHIVYNLIHQTMGGRIDCSSKPGEGARFRIELPGQIHQSTISAQQDTG